MFKNRLLDLEQLEKDFYEIIEIIREPALSRLSNPRCHEMAYLINAGMNHRDYESEMKDGFYLYGLLHLFDALLGIRQLHSWVEVDGVILNFHFGKPTYNGRSFNAQGEGEVIKSWRAKTRYLPWRIDYTLREGTEELAKELFE